LTVEDYDVIATVFSCHEKTAGGGTIAQEETHFNVHSRNDHSCESLLYRIWNQMFWNG